MRESRKKRASKKKRARMTRGQKKKLREMHQANQNMTQEELAKWAADEFALDVVPCRMMIYRILNATDDAYAQSTCKTLQSVASKQLEELLVAWVRACEQHNLPVITGAAVRAKAEKLSRFLLPTVTPAVAEKLTDLTFSLGWLTKFQARHDLVSRRLHGEASSVNMNVVKEGRSEMKEATREYDRTDVFNLDETAFFYCSTSSKSMTSAPMAGRKQDKKRLTVAMCSNADGTTKIPLLFVGAVKQPRCFKCKTALELGFDYKCTKKGWMTTQLFKSWLLRFDAKMGVEGRRVLLLVDNVSSHRLDEPLAHVELRMLPPNTTAFLQPLDAGIISTFKAHINKIQNDHVVDEFDAMLERIARDPDGIYEKEIDSLFKVDVKVAMTWAKEAWLRVTSTTIQHCWKRTQVLDEDIYELVEKMNYLRTSVL